MRDVYTMYSKLSFKHLPLLDPKIIRKYIRGIPVKWDYHRDLPPIRTIARPNSKEWKKRVKEEIRAFEIWKKFNPSLPFRNLRWDDKFYTFTVEVNIKQLFGVTWSGKEWITVRIVISRNYPRTLPDFANYTPEDHVFQRLVFKATRGSPFCIPPVFYGKLRKLGLHAGIVHFLDVFLTWISLFKKSLRLN